MNNEVGEGIMTGTGLDEGCITGIALGVGSRIDTGSGDTTP